MKDLCTILYCIFISRPRLFLVWISFLNPNNCNCSWKVCKWKVKVLIEWIRQFTDNVHNDYILIKQYIYIYSICIISEWLKYIKWNRNKENNSHSIDLYLNLYIYKDIITWGFMSMGKKINEHFFSPNTLKWFSEEKKFGKTKKQVAYHNRQRGWGWHPPPSFQSGAYSGFLKGGKARFKIYTYIARSAVPFSREARKFVGGPPPPHPIKIIIIITLGKTTEEL